MERYWVLCFVCLGLIGEKMGSFGAKELDISLGLWYDRGKLELYLMREVL
jgi:hypothetical protein